MRRIDQSSGPSSQTRVHEHEHKHARMSAEFLRIPRRGGERTGFTLVETLVSMAIIGLLLSITIPAVQSARESARLTECRSHLHELGTALSNYEEQHGALPGYVDPPNGIVSPLVKILPMLDQAALYESLVKQGISSSYYPDDPAIWKRPVLAALRCPSDQAAAAGTNYRFNQGTTGMDYADLRVLGPLSYKTSPLAKVTDGLSNTVIMSESLMSPAGPHTFHRADVWYAGLSQSANLSNAELISLCEAAAVNPVPTYPYAGHDWPVSGLGGAEYNHVVTPNSRVTNCRPDSPSLTLATDHHWGSGIMKASSYHTGGVNVLMLDGAVRFASDTIDLGVWQAISTRAGGETGVQF